MRQFFKRLLGDEKGQALAIVLGLLAIGGLTIAVSVNYATTSLIGSRIVGEDMRGVYAATAGMEHAFWSLREGGLAANATPENINQMAVSIEAEEEGT